MDKKKGPKEVGLLGELGSRRGFGEDWEGRVSDVSEIRGREVQTWYYYMFSTSLRVN